MEYIWPALPQNGPNRPESATVEPKLSFDHKLGTFAGQLWGSVWAPFRATSELARIAESTFPGV